MFGSKVRKQRIWAQLREKTNVLLAYAVMLLAAFIPCKILAAEADNANMGAASSGMKAAEREFKQAEDDFTQLSQGNSAQKTGKHAWSELPTQPSAPNAAVTARSMSDPANPALYGSPETGYAGTWTDPATGDIITSVIAPTPRQNDYSQNYPIIIEPNVGSWNSSGGSGTIWNGNNPQWPTTPDNPGWGNNPGAMPPPPPPPGPSMGMPGQNFYPSPPLPPNFHPGYRPLHPNPAPRPPAGNGPNWNQGITPGWNPGWNQGNNPGWNPGNNPGFQPGGNRPGWNPGNNPGWNQGGNPGWNPGNNPGFQPGGNRPGWNPGGNGWGGNMPSGMGPRPWRGNP